MDMLLLGSAYNYTYFKVSFCYAILGMLHALFLS